MRVVPVTNAAKISFFENHIPVWQAETDAIGLTPEQVAELEALTAEARDAYHDARIARNAAQSATLRQKQAVIKMAAFGGSLVNTIRAFAETTDDPSVYAEARIPAPKRGGPLGPAPTPTGVTTDLLNDGSIRVTWEALTKGRTSFTIERQTHTPGQKGTGPWAIIGTSTAKSFIDTDVPTGLASATYRVTAERPGGRSQPSQAISLLFGTRTPRSEQPMQIAA